MLTLDGGELRGEKLLVATDAPVSATVPEAGEWLQQATLAIRARVRWR
ncbi:MULTISPECIES: hypothetical protein [Amycolatopsis]|uniref:Uncharacterized protein n=2 Tax=Amycolatopsis TaxID=1813 RepID=A0A1I3VJD2_9PSEU|nr:hypothetical protein [Amycolatopsis sacchari]SFJ95365.1 hypothetical protein SAMN05421835_11150 [Amycolatopsis sacchari]